MLYVDKVRTYAKIITLQEAVERAVAECIKEGIFAEFLTRRKAEVVQMSIFEYYEEKEIEKIRRAEYEAGIEEGKIAGITVEKISVIRRSVVQKMELELISNILGVDVAYVKQVADLIAENEKDTDAQIATRILKRQ